MVRLAEKPLRKICYAIFEAADVPKNEAKTVSDVLVDTSIHGVDTHGVRLIPRYIAEIKKKTIVPGTQIETLIDTPTTAMWDAGQAFGFYTGAMAMETAIMKAKKYKIGSVGVMGGGHIGALYWYSYQAAKNNMIGWVNQRGADHNVAPYGGVEGRLGTNPISFAIPAGRYKPIILDIATNVSANNRLQIMAERGQKAPEGWLIRPDGTWATDPAAMTKGEAQAVAFGHPFSEYKGYGLKVVVEALGGAIGSGCCLQEKGFGCLYTAIDPTGFCSLDDFIARIESMINDLKSSKLRAGFKEIFYPGEPEWREEENRRKLGIFVDDPWWNNIVETAKKLGVDVDRIMKSGIVRS
jgi:LDH2 family malate/lactate/ureidoglycolate dehydrogenase